jgi:hypothetical protein
VSVRRSVLIQLVACWEFEDPLPHRYGVGVHREVCTVHNFHHFDIKSPLSDR